jgi:dienelactone hydrolase
LDQAKIQRFPAITCYLFAFGLFPLASCIFLKHRFVVHVLTPEVFIMRRRISLIALFSLLLALTTAATSPPWPRVIDLTASDGTKLKATYFGAAEPGPGVLLFHQCNRQRKIWDDLASRLSGSGINVLTSDFRGFGESGGTPPDQLTPQQNADLFQNKIPSDIDVAFQYLVSQPGVMKNVIGFGGASCGVDQSIQAARRHPETKSLVLLSGATDPDGRQFLRNSAKVPIFFAAADDDEAGIAVALMQWLYSIAPNPGNRFEHYASGGHGVEMFEAHKDLPDILVNWFVTTLIKTPGVAPVTNSKANPPRSSSMLAVIDSPGGPAKAAKMLAESRQHDPKAAPFPESIVNIIGYEHLQANDTKGALEILQLNVTAYPDSPNAYDSLSDAYLADGQKELALQNAKKAVELLTSDTRDPEDRRKLIKESAEEKIKQLSANSQ